MSHLVRIVNIRKITHDVKQFETEKPSGYRFAPGQATDLAINKKGWIEKFHPFTFTSLNSDKFLQFTIKAYSLNEYPDHEGVTEELHRLVVGDELLIGDPWGAIKYKGEGIFIAGGVGITPFIAIFKDLAQKNQIGGNTLFFSNKTSQDVISENSLYKWFGKENLRLVLSRENNKKYLSGHIDENFIKKYVYDFSQHFYLCGKKQMVQDLKIILERLGAKTQALVFEK